MPATRTELMKRLEAIGIEVRTVEHAPVFTVAESSALDRRIPGGHTKNLFLTDTRGGLWLVIAHAHTRVDLKALAKVIEAGRLSFGRPALLMETLGVTPGSVTAFALINDRDGKVGVIVDAALMAFETVNGHPLENSATTNIARDDLLRFIRACGHEPRILYLGGTGSRPPQVAPDPPSGHSTASDGAASPPPSAAER